MQQQISKMVADINTLTADSKERFPFPREVRFNRSAHSAVQKMYDSMGS